MITRKFRHVLCVIAQASTTQKKRRVSFDKCGRSLSRQPLERGIVELDIQHHKRAAPCRDRGLRTMA